MRFRGFRVLGFRFARSSVGCAVDESKLCDNPGPRTPRTKLKVESPNINP